MSLFRKPRQQAGFSLLEVMIAMTIMTLAFSAIYTSQSQNILLVTKTKELNIAGWLANNKMVESEHLYEGRPFGELPKAPEIEKFKAPFDRYTWKREIREIKFPDFPVGGREGEGVQEAVRILVKTITKFLNNSMREMIVTVTWQRGEGEQHLTLTTYLIDLNAEFNFSI